VVKNFERFGSFLNLSNAGYCWVSMFHCRVPSWRWKQGGWGSQGNMSGCHPTLLTSKTAVTSLHKQSVHSHVKDVSHTE
jgi:hypothetical protein